MKIMMEETGSITTMLYRYHSWLSNETSHSAEHRVGFYWKAQAIVPYYDLHQSSLVMDGRITHTLLFRHVCGLGLNFIRDETRSFISSTITLNYTAGHERFSTFIVLIADFMFD